MLLVDVLVIHPHALYRESIAAAIRLQRPLLVVAEATPDAVSGPRPATVMLIPGDITLALLPDPPPRRVACASLPAMLATIDGALDPLSHPDSPV